MVTLSADSENPVLKERTHLLIVGAPRSGTTLLAAMIGRHSDIALLNEGEGSAMSRIISKSVVGNKRCIPNQIEISKKRDGIFRLKLFRRLALSDEFPRSTDSIEDYLRLPNMRIVAVVRNGNDVISSIMQRGKRNFSSASYRWYRAVEIMHELKNSLGEQVLVVAFEELILNPERNIRRVATFLRVDFQPEMLEGHKYNWYYPDETSLNPEKVNRFVREKVDFDLRQRFPSVWAKYEELLGYAKS